MAFKPQHMNATVKDFQGNNGIGPYVFLTGSDERAQQISHYFTELVVKNHPRQHNLYLGTLNLQEQSIPVAAISTGMGGASADIIINELILLGAKRLLRVGTAGSLQPKAVRTGDIVVATAAVRDDKASWDYIFPEYPAISALPYLIAAGRAANTMANTIHFGIVHSKSSLYAREFNHSLLAKNELYMQSLRLAGVLASEMECAQLFSLSTLLGKKLSLSQPILAGAILAIVGDKTSFSKKEKAVSEAVTKAIELALATVLEIHLIDRGIKLVF